MYWAHGVRTVRAESTLAGRAARQTDADADIAAACTAHHRMEAAEKASTAL